MSFAVRNALPYVDDLVREYLLFRGFAKALHHFESDAKGDKMHSFNVSKLVDTIFGYIHSFSLEPLLELWGYLHNRFFSRLDVSLLPSVKKLDLSLWRYYVVHAISSSRPDKVFEFYEKYGHSLCLDQEWKPWFMLPYMKNPEADETFSPFFQRKWKETFSASLHNFLSSIFHNMSLPKLLNFNIERLRRKQMESEIEYLRNEIHRLKSELDETTDSLETLKRSRGQITHQVEKTDKNNPPLLKAIPNESINKARIRIQEAEQRMRQTRSRWGSEAIQSSIRTTRRERIEVAHSPDNHEKELEIGGGRKGTKGSTEALRVSAGDGDLNNRAPMYAPLPSGSAEEDEEEDEDYTLSSGRHSLQQSDEDAPSSSSVDSPPASSVTLGGRGSPITRVKQVGKIVTEKMFTGHAAPVSRCRFSSSGEYIASGSTDGTVRIWSVNSKTAEPRNATLFCFSEILSLAWETKADRLLLCGTSDGRIKLWNSSSEKVVGDIVTEIDYPRVLDLACSPSDAVFVSATSSLSQSSSGEVSVWDLRTLQLQRKLNLENGIAINSVEFNHNGSLLLTGGRDGIVRVYDMMSSSTPIMQWQADPTELSCVRFSRDETAIFTLGTTNEIHEWSIHNIGKKVNSYNWEESGPSDIAFNWEGNQFVVGGKVNSAFIYQAGKSEPLLRLQGHGKAVMTVDWHPTNNVCITGSLDNTVRIITLS
ncbi:WD repeat-containing protein 91 [Balamuthia mandrillaris]